jgi:hypothetical protein
VSTMDGGKLYKIPDGCVLSCDKCIHGLVV